MNWLDPVWLAVTAAALFLTIICWRIGAWRKKRALHALLGDFADDPGAVRLSRPRRILRHVLLWSAIALLGITAARPYWKTLPVPVLSTGRDILVLFDVSKSMRSTDLAPSRIEHARYLLREIVAAFPGDRFGLIAFAGKAFLSCPLTRDGIAFDQYVDELSTDTVPVGGTDLEAGFAAALRALRAADGEGKTLLVMTDGEELTGDSARLATELKTEKVQLVIVGLGDTSGAPVLDDQGNFRRDANGKIIMSHLNETKLQQIAAACGGIYLRSTVADNGLNAIRRILATHPKHAQSDSSRVIPVENFTLPLMFAAILLILYFLIPERKKALLLILALSAWCVSGAETRASLYRDALAGQQKGENDPAIAIYEKLLADPALPAALAARIRQNLGVVPHLAAQLALADARKEVEKQQLDAALKQLADCEKQLADAESYYAGAFTAGAKDFDERSLSDDLALLNADRNEMEKLKKEIEQLKQQQQQVRDQAQQAKQQNQQSRDNASKQPGQPKPEQPSGQPDPADQAMKKASEAAGQLAHSAARMKQNALRDAAEKAKKSLDEARQNAQKGDRDAADRKLDEAIAALGGERSKENAGSPEKSAENGEKKPDSDGAAQAGKEEKNDAQKAENERLLLQMLDQENDRRHQLAPRSGSGRIRKIEKDW